MHASLRVCLGRLGGQAMVILGFGLRWRTCLENFYSLLQLAILPPQLADLSRFGAADPGRLPLVDLGLPDPLAQRQ